MEPQPELQSRFSGLIDDWKRKHGLRDDDPVLLCVELFRLHQDQWDELRRRDLPSFQQFREDIAMLVQASSAFRQEAVALADLLKIQGGTPSRAIPPNLAIFCISLALVAGVILGGIFL